MNQDKPFVVRALIGLWALINGARIVFLNLLFLAFLVFFIALVIEPDATMRLESNTALVLRPYGQVVEEYSSAPLDRAIEQSLGQVWPETRLRDLLRAIERAGRDPRITRMVIETDYLWGIGLSSLHDLERAIDDFKAAGKPVIAMGDGMGQHQYYLAAMADEVWLHPDGLVWIDGYANFRNFYKEGLDKLEVEINLFRVGEYKSAMEPFIRNDMSPEAREASLHWLSSLWQQYLEGVSRHRGLPLESLDAVLEDVAGEIESVDGDFARFALEKGLVDRLISRPEARQELALRGAPGDYADGYRAVGFMDYLDLTDLGIPGVRKAAVTVVVAEGEIINGPQQPGTVGSESTIEQLREIGNDPATRAVVLRVNSPGGDALASEKIRRQVQALRDAGKTVVVSMGDVAASGGYWISLAADEIWASPSTITGSIGVFGILPTFGATLNRIGIHSDGVGTTPLAGKLRLDRPLDDDLRRVFQASTEHVYNEFLERVRDARGEDVDVEAAARGRVWSGAQAAELRLVDRTGTLQDAIDAAARIAGLGASYEVEWFEFELTPFEQMLLDFTTGVAGALDIGGQLSRVGPPGFVQQLLDDLQRLAGTDGRLTIAAHCLCGVR